MLGGRGGVGRTPAGVGLAVGDEGHKLRHVAEVRLTFGHKAAQQIYFKLGLDVVPAMLEPDPQPTLFDQEEEGRQAA